MMRTNLLGIVRSGRTIRHIMNTNILLYGITFFVFIFILHVIYWRTARPKNHITPLFVIFILAPALMILIGYPLMTNLLPPGDYRLSVLLYFAIAGVYVMTYPGFQANCPSLFIVNFIGNSKNGAGFDEIKKAVDQKKLTRIEARVEDLIEDGLVTLRPGNKLLLTKRGAILATLFMFYRTALLGLKEGEG